MSADTFPSRLAKMRLSIAVILLLTANVASAQIQLTIAVEPSATLPGLVPSLRVQARNYGSTPAEVPWLVALSVAVADQEPFLAGSPGPSHVTRELPTARGESTIVPPGETRDFTFWTAGYSVASWFVSDVRLAQLGTYRLKLIAGAEPGELSHSHTSRTTPRPAPITSNEVTYTILEPKGEDAAVWARMRELPILDYWCRDLAAEIWENHPDSTYAAYCVPRIEPPDEDRAIATYEEVLKKGPDAVTADAYRLTMAEFELDRVHRAVISRDLATAVDASERAQHLLTRLAKEASDPRTRQAAADKLRTDVRTREELIEDIEATQGRFPTDMRPGVDCIEKLPDGSSILWFAYQNPTRDAIKEPIGARNKFTPPPFDRSQPTTFAPGIHHLVFSIPATVPELTWHLQKSQLAVKVRDVPVCSVEDLEQYRQWHPAKP